jgi:hypothetical protein
MALVAMVGTESRAQQRGHRAGEAKIIYAVRQIL